MGKISDIWVRLGLKKDGFDKGMDDAAKKTEKTGGKMSKMLNAAKAGWAAVGAAAIAFGTQMIEATNKVGDAWNHRMAEMRGAWQSVLADISNYKPDFSSLKNFFKNDIQWLKQTFGNAKEAGDAARAMSEAFDAEFELENSLRIQRAKISGELADLQVEMRNTALSPEQRKAATDRYRSLLEPLYQAEISTRKNMLDAAVKAWLAGTGVSASTQEVSDFFANYGINPQAAAAANPELARVYETRKGDKANQPIFDAITKLTQAENGLAVELKMVNRTAAIIEKAMKDGVIDIGKLNEAMLEDYGEDMELEDIDLSDIKVIPPDFSALDAEFERAKKSVDDFEAHLAEEAGKVAELNGMLSGAMVAAMSNGMQVLTDMMVGLEGADASQLLGALMEPFANTAIQLGEMLLAQGIAVEAFKKSLESLQGGVAIAAGLGLIAIGSAMRSGIQALASGGGATSTGSYTGAAASSSADVQNYESTLTIEVVGKISGSDIILSGNKTMNKWNR